MPNPIPKYDLAILGGGIVGLATAFQYLSRFPDKRVVVLEKESELATHQTGHNSGVLHSGIYYKPGSLKATNCREGKLAMQAFCEEYQIPFDICGKVIVAIDESDTTALNNIYERGQANGVNCRMISSAELGELEPHSKGVAAIHVPESGIVDYRAVCLKLADLINQKGSETFTSACVTAIRKEADQVIVSTTAGDFASDLVVNCTGLHSDRIAKLSGAKPKAKIVPFRGEYFKLKPEAKHLVKNLIYPTPDPSFPFLGVHFTRMINGDVECGPNAVLALAREGYTKTKINFGDLAESLCYGGFLKLALKHWQMGTDEMWRSVSKKAFVKALQRLVPEIQTDMLEAAPAGVRAQAVLPDGSMVDDFLIDRSDRVINILNAPSPAATASLQIGKTIVDKIES